METYKLGVDVGGTKIAYGLFSNDNKLIEKRITKTNANATPDQLVETVTVDIKSIIEQRNLDEKHLKGIGFGFPSYVEFSKGKVLFSTNMPNIKDFNARSAFEKKFPYAKILVDNDTNLAAIAEHRFGAGRGFEHIVYTALSTGVGSGFIINDQIFRGSYGGAGESGHMLITPDEGVMCGCENRGCFMSYTSGSMIKKHIIKAIEAGEKSIMTEMVDGNLDLISAKHLNDAFKLSDKLAEKMLDQMARYIGIYIYNTFIQLNINCYVFGGGMTKFGNPLFNRIKATVEKYKHQDDQEIYYKVAELGQDFGIIGAALLLN